MPDPSLREAARAYQKAGWHPLMLPAGAKGPPPEGRTGYGGSDMTPEEIADALWAGNIGVRMPVDVIGLDVDVYKGGDRSLEELLAHCGPLPNTWISHSGRGDGSGIRFFRVPTGLAWVAGLAGLDIIQRSHRYAAVWPSVHPDGRRYQWVDQSEGRTDEVPLVEDLPELPWPWIAELSRAAANDPRSSAVDVTGLTAFVEAHTQADQPSYVSTILAHFRDHWQQGYSRHDTMQHCLIWAMECVRAGVAAARPTIHQLGELWVEAVSPDARRAELTSQRRTTEFEAMLRHAIGRVEAKPEAEILRIHDEIAGVPMRPAPSPEVTAPSGVFLDWRAFAERDTDSRRWLVESFWPWGRSMALWAAAKQGKSELALWCGAKLAMGEHPWSGSAIEPIDVVYLDWEMTEDDLDDRLSDFGIDPLRLEHLHYALLPPLHSLDIEKGGAQLEELVTSVGAQAVIIDTFSRAVAGEENEADTVRAFYRHTGSRLKRLGIGYLRTDHAGKDRTKGQRGTSAKRDDVDVIWSMSRTKGGVLLDCTGSTRLSWVGPSLQVERHVSHGTVSYTAPLRFGWPAGTAAKAAELDALGIPKTAGRPTVEAALKAAGHQIGHKRVLQAAIRYRQDPTSLSPEGCEQPDSGWGSAVGQHPGHRLPYSANGQGGAE